MKLLGRTSSINVRKVLWTARELGLDFEHDDRWAAQMPTTAPEFLSLNPNGLVPVWEDERGTLWESNTICRYLAARHDRTDLLPNEPFERALVERWMDWVAGDLNMAWRYAFMALVRRHPDFVAEADIERSLANWDRLMSVLDVHLSDCGPYAGGVSFTLADVAVGLAVHRWRCTPRERPHLRQVEAYFDRLRERSAFADLATVDMP